MFISLSVLIFTGKGGKMTAPAVGARTLLLLTMYRRIDPANRPKKQAGKLR